MKIESVKYISGFTLHVKFLDGVEGDIELSDLVDKGIFSVLQSQEYFAKAYNTGYSIAWSDELEIDSDTIYMEISGKSLDALHPQNPAHASN
jgi:hypothetical protein